MSKGIISNSQNLSQSPIFAQKMAAGSKNIWEQFFPIWLLVGEGAPEKFDELRKNVCRA